jgi:hypothetical protein
MTTCQHTQYSEEAGGYMQCEHKATKARVVHSKPAPLSGEHTYIVQVCGEH